MGWNNKEIEAKLLYDSLDSDSPLKKLKVRPLVAQLREVFSTEITSVITGNSADFYWKVDKKDAAFVRIRQHEAGRAEITVKSPPKRNGTGNLNRVEIDLPVPSIKDAMEFFSHVHGKKYTNVTKKYHVLFLGDMHTNISVYQIKNDPQKRLFVEIEAKTEKELIKILKKLTYHFPTGFLWVKSSIYEMYVKRDQVQLSNTMDLFKQLKKGKSK